MSVQADHRLLGVFLKYPEPGQVKTRLARALGDDAAAAWYREMAELVLERTAADEEYRRILFVTPEERILDFVRWLPDETFLPQRGADLGERMAGAVSQLLGSGGYALLIGTDAPDISKAVIVQAFDALCLHDVVIGPAEDGGYYLIGVRRAHADLFDGIVWSTPEVLPATLEKIKMLGLSYALLPELADIDTIEDYEKWKAGRVTRRRGRAD